MHMFDLQNGALVIAVALAGALLGLDRTAVGQFMISQPIVAGPFAGWLLGDIVAGTVIGAALELIWVLDMPIGTFVPADATIGTVSATTIASLGSPGNAALDLIGFSIVLTTGMVPITMAVDEYVRKRNSALVERAVCSNDEDPGRKLARAHLTGPVVFFLKSFILYMILIPAGLAAVAFFGHVPQTLHHAMALFAKTLPWLGAALVLNKLSIRVLDRSLLTGFVASVILTVALGPSPVMIVLFVLVAGLVGARIANGEWA